MRFDLDCDLRGRVVSDPHPERRHSSPMMDNDPWRERVRYVVDLEAMIYCDPASCRNQGPSRIASVTPEHISFYDETHMRWSVRLRDGRSRLHLEDDGRILETTGQCSIEPFSGFPPLRDRAE
jgi:hypothetical protein